MFLSVDLNPYIEKRYKVDSININRSVNIKNSVYSPGTRSIISSVILNMFNEIKRAYLTK